MEKTIKIEGMSCNHCVNRIETSIKRITEIEEVTVSLADKEAKLVGTALDSITDKLDKAVRDTGCKVVW